MVTSPGPVFLWTACSPISLTPRWVLIKTDSSSTTELFSTPCTSESPEELQKSPTSRLDPSPRILESLGVEPSQDKDGDKKRERRGPASPEDLDSGVGHVMGRQKEEEVHRGRQ